MLLSIIMMTPVNAQATTIGVEPEEKIDPALTTFKVEVWVRNVADLAGVEFKLGYNTTVLTATLIEYGGIFGDTYFPTGSKINDTEGWLFYGVMEMWGELGFTGDGKVAIITFTVDHSTPGTILNLYETKLGDSAFPYPNPIDHKIIDGFFNQIRGDVNNDGKVDRNDLVRIANAYGSKSGDVNWDENADIDRYRDGVINVYDLMACSKNYGKKI